MRSRYRAFAWENALLVATLVSLVTTVVLISARKTFWNDEIITWKLITDPSYRHMLWAVAHACDGSPPGFHILARAWASVFGSSVLSLRLFSCAGMCVAIVATWTTLRRHFEVRAVAFAVLTEMFTSTLFLNYAAEARNYGLYLAFTALLIAVLDRIDAEGSPAFRWLTWLFVLTVLLSYSHYFGVLAGGMLFAVVIACDVARRRFRARVYLAISLGWAPLLLWLRPMQREQALFRERTYFNAPNSLDLLHIYGSLVPLVPLCVFLALCGLTALAFRHGTRKSPSDQPRLPMTLVAIGAAFVVAPLILAFAAHQDRSLYNERYVMPSILGSAILLALFADRLLLTLPAAPAGSRRSLPILISACWASLLLALIFAPLQDAIVWPRIPTINSQLAPLAPPDLPIVIEGQHQWMQAMFTDGRAEPPYYFILDREAAMAPDSAVDDPFFFNERSAWKAAGYWSGNTLENRDFLCRFSRFGVLAMPNRVWFLKRVAANPAFSIERETRVDLGRLVIVHRKPGAALPFCPATAKTVFASTR